MHDYLNTESLEVSLPRKCHECQHDNPPDAVFYRSCGTRLEFAEVTIDRTKSIVDSKAVHRKIIAGKYRLIKELGRRGMGVVYKAENVKRKRSVTF